ncbi:MAG: DUF2292 domain-containing protein [Acidobacteriaceae bacterium]
MGDQEEGKKRDRDHTVVQMPVRSPHPTQEEFQLAISDALRDMRYGEVIVKVDSGKVIYIDRHERVRMGKVGGRGATDPNPDGA